MAVSQNMAETGLFKCHYIYIYIYIYIYLYYFNMIKMSIYNSMILLQLIIQLLNNYRIVYECNSTSLFLNLLKWISLIKYFKRYLKCDIIFRYKVKWQ